MHHRASDPEKEKTEGFHGGGVYFFLPWFSQDPNTEPPKLFFRNRNRNRRDAAFPLTVGSFLLTVELLCLQLVWGAFRLQLDLLSVGLFYLQLKLFYVHWESSSNKHLNGL